MRKGTHLYVVIVIGLLAIVFNASPRSQSTGDAEKELARIEKEWRTLRGGYNGVRGEGIVRFTHVYIERDGRWQLVASQGTWVQKK